jgi:hypothetical protein
MIDLAFYKPLASSEGTGPRAKARLKIITTFG